MGNVTQMKKNDSAKILSVIMAAFNEEKTIQATIEAVLAKQITGMEIKLIIVESGSTDKTTHIVRTYENHERVKVVYQTVALGKGNAIREGFKHAKGDIILIQDADNEYDINDYEALIEPIIFGEASFVLGSRHGGKAWKMRKFSNQCLTGHFMNLGHWFFTFLINLLFGLRLKDPFTMYKVFRADCLEGLSFECDRFDFDFELLIKLTQKKYYPLEVPVNYHSRSFKDGKKIKIFYDPLTWIRALIKLRLS